MRTKLPSFTSIKRSFFSCHTSLYICSHTLRAILVICEVYRIFQVHPSFMSLISIVLLSLLAIQSSHAMINLRVARSAGWFWHLIPIIVLSTCRNDPVHLPPISHYGAMLTHGVSWFYHYDFLSQIYDLWSSQWLRCVCSFIVFRLHYSISHSVCIQRLRFAYFLWNRKQFLLIFDTLICLQTCTAFVWPPVSAVSSTTLRATQWLRNVIRSEIKDQWSDCTISPNIPFIVIVSLLFWDQRSSHFTLLQANVGFYYNYKQSCVKIKC